MLTLETLWQDAGFSPNPNQRAAILHTNGPLYLPAGPGSGKTRVLLWRTLNLIVFHGIQPDEIYLATFTEKAAHQLKEGLRSLLGRVTALTDQPYDIAKMYVGTVHSLCQQLIVDRRFYPNRQRAKPPTLLDDLGQFFHLYRTKQWEQLLAHAGFNGNASEQINQVFEQNSSSRFHAVSNCIAFFNRLSEECIDPQTLPQQPSNPVVAQLLQMYEHYRALLHANAAAPLTDFSLLQQAALNVLNNFNGAGNVFKHVIIDEYQDTNTVQEQLFFRLAAGSKNICVVGDDDQALYRFRGATVENFVEFPARCEHYLGVKPTPIPLATNYRSRQQIVDFYTRFIAQHDWRKPAPQTGHFRVTSKNIQAHSNDRGVAVVASTPAKPDVVAAEVAELVCALLETGRVENPNQIAFLFPSLKTQAVQQMKAALEARGLRVYAPRAGRFLEVEEALDLFGLFLHVFGRPKRGNYRSHDYESFHEWIDMAFARGAELCRADPRLDHYVRDRQQELKTIGEDWGILTAVASAQGWDLSAPYDLARMKRPLYNAPGLSERARRQLGSAYFERAVQSRREQGAPFPLNYVINAATALDWNILDLFYRLCGFAHFTAMFDLAERGEDEGPICNLSLISQYLARFIDEYLSIISAARLHDDGFVNLLFSSYLFVLFRRGESEYEDAEDPFPKGRIPFLTIHQSKGLEFPVVVLGNVRKDTYKGPQPVECMVRPLVTRSGEPLDRMAEFDAMRMFYVALSRAQNLLVIAHFKGPGQRINEPFKTLLDDHFPRVPTLQVASLPAAHLQEAELPRNYSYTGDYLLYQKCPRLYMIFRKYDFVPSRSQTMMFGSLVHRTLEDLHQLLIAQRQHA